MSGGLLDGLSNEDAARLAFTLATPIIGAAAALKLPELLGPQGDDVRESPPRLQPVD
jgi:undecaprenyl-diphosphatase